MMFFENDDNAVFVNPVETINLEDIVFGRVSRDFKKYDEESIYFFNTSDYIDVIACENIKALVISQENAQLRLVKNVLNIPVVVVEPKTSFFEGDIITINKNGRIHKNFRVKSKNNAFLVTETCNNFCIMCPQPPKKNDAFQFSDLESRVSSIIGNIDPVDFPETLCITGGEPTMLKDSLIRIIDNISSAMPGTIIHLLSNGRTLSYPAYAHDIAKASRRRILIAIPIFSHVSNIHDYIVQCQGAFDQTIAGIYECYKNSIPVELRVVLHKQTIPYLIDLAEFISRNLFFVKHVALMGMENMGFAKLNRDDLYMDPLDYKDTLSEAISLLKSHAIDVTIYNLPLCTVNNDVMDICEKSISDFKQVYFEQCKSCSKFEECSGFFSSTTEKFSLTRRITPFH